MRDTTKVCLPFLIGALIAGTCAAQAPKDENEHFYRLDFVVKEVDGAKVVNSRSYTMSVSTGKRAEPTEIRTGNKVPYRTDSGQQGKYDYQYVGVYIECARFREVQDQLALNVRADITSLASPPTGDSGGLPLIRTNAWKADVLLSPRQPAIIFSSDDPTSTHKMQVEVTAMPIGPSEQTR